MTARWTTGVVVVGALGMLAGCGKRPSYHAQPLVQVAHASAQWSGEQSGVTVHVRSFATNDVQQFLGNRPVFKSSRANKQYLVPVQLTVDNQSSYAVALLPASVFLDSASVAEVFDQTRFYSAGGTLLTVSGWSLLGLGMIELGLSMCGFSGGNSVITGLGYGMIIAGAGSGVRGVATKAVERSRSINVDECLRHDLEEKMLHREEIIAPAMTINKLVMVPASKMKSSFAIKLVDQHNREHILSYAVQFAGKV